MHKFAVRLVATAALLACTALPIGAQNIPPNPEVPDRVLRDAGPHAPPPRDGLGVSQLSILAMLLAVGLALGLPAVLVIRRWDWQQRGRLEGGDQPPTADPPEWTAPNETRAERALGGRRPAPR